MSLRNSINLKHYLSSRRNILSLMYNSVCLAVDKFKPPAVKWTCQIELKSPVSNPSISILFSLQKIALDKLLVRLHKMYEAIGQATQTTIDPTLKDEKIETVMGKLECK